MNSICVHGAAHEYKMTHAQHGTWWQLNGSRWPKLQGVALRAFAVGTSSSTSERNFSTFGHLWSKRANQLSFDTINKLVYCYNNLRSLQKLRDGTGRARITEPGTTG